MQVSAEDDCLIIITIQIILLLLSIQISELTIQCICNL